MELSGLTEAFVYGCGCVIAIGIGIYWARAGTWFCQKVLTLLNR